MKRALYVLSVFFVATRRLLHQRGLAVSMLLGLVAAVALTVSVPIYSDAISYRILNDRLYNNPDDPRPPFSFLFRYVGSWHGYLEWQDCRDADTYITELAAAKLGLPQEMLVRHFKTDVMRLFPASESAYSAADQPLEYISLGFISGLEPRIELLAGRFPAPVTNNTDPVEVLVSDALVEELGVQVGEQYVVYYQEPSAAESKVKTFFQHPVRIAGIWRARDPNEDFWFYRQSALEDVLLMPEPSYVQMAQGMKGEVGLALWSLLCNGDQVRSIDVGPLLGRSALVRKEVDMLLRDIEIVRSPEEALTNYGRTVRLLTILLYVFSVPVLGLILYFIALVSGMIVQRQRNEVAMIRSRGTTTLQVVGIYFMEGLVVGGISIVIGSILGERMAQAMGLTRSFLVLEDRPFLPTTLSWTNLRYGLLALVASLLASVVPAVGASQKTVVTYKQEQARSLKAPFWQRAFLDLLLLVPGLYGYYLLEQRGTISFLETGDQTGSPFSNPYLFVVPVVLVFALSLFCIRVFPWVMRFFAWLANSLRSVVPVLALRHLSRTARHYTGPMLLLIFTLSLAVFTASMAETLDNYTVDRSYYEIGADYRLVEMGESTQAVGGMGGAPAEGGSQNDEEDAGPLWLFLPVSEHETIPGVEHAARVWDRAIRVRLGGQSVDATLLGIDRVDFPRASFYRRDFAPASLGALMNALAVRDDAILISREVLNLGLEVGDKVQVLIPVGSGPKVDFTVAGVVDLFPRLYPEDGPFFIANLDFIFNSVGGVYPYDVWLKVDPSVDRQTLLEGVEELGIDVMRAYSAQERIDGEQLQPERQGVFGLLSVGFASSAFLTVLGFLIYSYVSFLQRYIELGVLRAIGLSVRQMALFLIVEQLSLVLTGVVAGTALGVLASRLFIPFFQVRGGQHPFTPPFVVLVAWAEIQYIYVIFGVMFVAAVIVLLFSLRRMRIFEAVKLGETT